MNLLDSLKSHWLVFTLAVLVAGVYGSHNFLIPEILNRQNQTYRPVTIASNIDEGEYYGPRANAVYHGQLIPGDILVPENAGSPAMLPILNPIIMGYLGRFLGSLDRAFIVSDFLFPALIFIALYFLAFELTRKKLLSVFFAVFFIFIPEAMLYLPPVSGSVFNQLLKNILPDPNNGLYFLRFEYPKVTYLFYVLTFYFTLRVIKRQEKWNIWLAGISFGSLFYTYLYDWVYVLFGLLILAVGLIVVKNYQKGLSIARIIGIGLLLSIAYWFNFLLLHNLPHYSDLMARIGVEIGRQFRFATVWKSYLRNIALIGLLVLAFWKKEKTIFLYLGSFLVPYFFVVNLQLVLGYNPHPDHWYRVEFLPIAATFLLLGNWLYEKYVHQVKLKFVSISALVLIAAIFGRSLYSEYLFSERNATNFTISKAYADSYDWLNANAKRGAVVGSINPTTEVELSLYTGTKIFLLNGFHTTVSDAKIWERLIEISDAYGLTAEQFSSIIKNSSFVEYLFHNEYRDRSFDSNFRNDDNGRNLSATVISKKIGSYRQFQVSSAAVIPTDVDYLYFGSRERALVNDLVRFLPNVQKVYDRDGVKIYKIIK